MLLPKSLSVLLALAVASPALGWSDKFRPGGSAGCWKPQTYTSLRPGRGTEGFAFGDRNVRVSIPGDYRSGFPVAMVLAYHGTEDGLDAEAAVKKFEEESKLDEGGFNFGPIVVFVEGVDGKWTGQPDAREDIDDVAFASTLLDRLENRFCIDVNRVYATGQGHGGGLVHLLACDPALSKRIAAFAIVGGAFYEEGKRWSSCEPGRKLVPMLEIHGEKDERFDYRGDVDKAHPRIQVVRWLIEWAIRNGCGMGVGEPRMQDGKVTSALERGTITEEETDGLFVKAEYRCWVDGEAREGKILGLDHEGNIRPRDEVDAEFQERNLEAIRKGVNDEKTEETEEGAVEGAAPEGQQKALKTSEEKTVDDDKVLAESTEEEEKVARNGEEDQDDETTDDMEKTKKKEPIAVKGDLIVQHYQVEGFGHGWPRVQRPASKEKADGNESGVQEIRSFDATEIIMAWFQIHTLKRETEAEIRNYGEAALEALMKEAAKESNAKMVAEGSDPVVPSEDIGGSEPLENLKEPLLTEVNEAMKKLDERLGENLDKIAESEEHDVQQVLNSKELTEEEKSERVEEIKADQKSRAAEKLRENSEAGSEATSDEQRELALMKEREKLKHARTRDEL